MALERTSSRYAPRWGQRMVEWGCLAIIILIIGGVFGHYAHQVQGQSERASVQATLGALRTAMVLENIHLIVARRQQSEISASRNPFDTLERLPSNYGGIVQSKDWDAVTPGTWVFDSECICIGYRPLNPEWLESPHGAQMLWYSAANESSALQLRPMAIYRWQGLEVR